MILRKNDAQLAIYHQNEARIKHDACTEHHSNVYIYSLEWAPKKIKLKRGKIANLSFRLEQFRQIKIEKI